MYYNLPHEQTQQKPSCKLVLLILHIKRYSYQQHYILHSCERRKITGYYYINSTIIVIKRVCHSALNQRDLNILSKY